MQLNSSLLSCIRSNTCISNIVSLHTAQSVRKDDSSSSSNEIYSQPNGPDKLQNRCNPLDKVEKHFSSEHALTEEFNHNNNFWKKFGESYMQGASNEAVSNTSEILPTTCDIAESTPKLSHVDVKGEAQMVNVAGKQVTRRKAEAKAEVYLGAEAFHLVKENKMKKGDVLGVARIAGIMAAKKTSELIPLCHPLQVDHVEVQLSLQEKAEDGREFCVSIKTSASTSGRTGVEMEALMAASVAALTVYDMCKAVSHEIVISGICLLCKTGGKQDYYFK